MPRTLSLIFIAIFLLTACAPATALPTEPPTTTPIPPTATATPFPTNTPTPTLEPWMASLPSPDLEVKADENGNINAYDGEALVYSWDGSEWVEYSPYNIVREAGKESEMSTVEWVQRGDGSWGLSEELLEWERENMLPTKLTNEQAAGINYWDHWWGNEKNLGIGFIIPDDIKTLDVVQLLSVYRATLAPWGLTDEGYVITFQYTNGDNTQSLVHFLATPESYERMVNEGIYERKGSLAHSAVIGPSSQSRMYPEEKYNDLVENFYMVQLGTTSKTEAKKHMVALAAQVGKSETMAGDPEELIWSGDWIPEW